MGIEEEDEEDIEEVEEFSPVTKPGEFVVEEGPNSASETPIDKVGEEKIPPLPVKEEG
jgi:hypothetical protein